MVLEKTLGSLLDCKEIKPVHSKEDQSWVFIGRTDAEGEAPVLWPPDVKNWLIGKDPDGGKDWRQEEEKKKKAGGEGDDREWDGWMASVTQWIRVWINYGSWQWAGMLGMLQSMGSQRVGQDWVIELNWTELIGVLWYFIIVFTNDKWYTESYQMLICHLCIYFVSYL